MKHWIEDVVDEVVEDARYVLDTIWESLLTDGRPIFNVELTKQQQLQRFMDLPTRAEIAEHIRRFEGVEEAIKYLNRMEREKNE